MEVGQTAAVAAADQVEVRQAEKAAEKAAVLAEVPQRAEAHL